jgi:hypothetical protein
MEDKLIVIIKMKIKMHCENISKIRLENRKNTDKHLPEVQFRTSLKLLKLFGFRP